MADDLDDENELEFFALTEKRGNGTGAPGSAGGVLIVPGMAKSSAELEAIAASYLRNPVEVQFEDFSDA